MTLRDHIRRRWNLPAWDERVKIVAALVPPGSRVLDVGAGAQTLRDYISRDCKYTPADRVVANSSTLRLDFNHDVWPKGTWDVAVLSGALEFAAKPSEVLERLRRIVPVVILTYEAGGSLKQRQKSGFYNHMSRAGLEVIMTRLRWAYRPVSIWRSQVVYVLKKL